MYHFISRLMARFYLAFETMKNFFKIVSDKKTEAVGMETLLKALCESKELQGWERRDVSNGMDPIVKHRMGSYLAERSDWLDR